MNDVTALGAVETLQLFRAKQLSPMEALTALIDQVERYEPTINAVIDRRYDEAIEEARASTQRYAEGRELALDGLAVAAKEEHPMRGRLWQQGSFTLRDEVADVDHPIIERIQQAGAIIHVRTSTPEFCCAGFCHSTLWGITRNPWNTEFSPGGSSGGTSAALAAGYAPLGTGSDIGGSIRIPASFGGIVGYIKQYEMLNIETSMRQKFWGILRRVFMAGFAGWIQPRNTARSDMSIPNVLLTLYADLLVW